jgi:hypothetical protein
MGTLPDLPPAPVVEGGITIRVRNARRAAGIGVAV